MSGEHTHDGDEEGELDEERQVGEGASSGEADRGIPGQAIVVASWVGTALYVAVAVAATASLALMAGVVVVSLVLFAVGTVAFLAAYFRAIGRSRYEAIGMGGLFFLGGSAPARVRRLLLTPLVIQVVVALVTSWVRMYTGVAFGILVPMYGLGLLGLWASRYGSFPPRQQKVAPPPDLG